MFGSFESSNFVLARYRRALGMRCELDPEQLANNLQAIAVKHFQTYSFHSLYFNLHDKTSEPTCDMPLVLNRNALIHQLMDHGGGSCFHHNAVFQAILDANHIENWLVSCLVHDPLHPENTFDFATHIAIVFKHQGVCYLFDPGWDGTSFSIFPVPQGDNPPCTHQQHQVRRTNHAEFPLTFEEMKPDGHCVPRYDFGLSPTAIEDYQDAIDYLNSPRYAFHTLFLFTQIDEQRNIIRFVNRRLIIQTLQGEVLHNDELPEEESVLQKITEHLGPQTGMLASLHTEDFKNPSLGVRVCESAASTLTMSCL